MSLVRFVAISPPAARDEAERAVVIGQIARQADLEIVIDRGRAGLLNSLRSAAAV